MATYFINEVYELSEEFIDELHNQLALEFSKHNPHCDLKNALSTLYTDVFTYFLLTIDNKPVSLVIGIAEGDQFTIGEIHSIAYNGSRDYLYESTYFDTLNNALIERGFTSKKFITSKTARDDNWIRRTCTEHPLADSYAPTLEETETHSIWTWSFS